MIIDVSYHNGRIDWAKVKGKIDRAILRLGYGTDIASQDDKEFKRNLQQCKKLGIPFDTYIYSYATTVSKVKSEAAHVMRLIKPSKKRIVYFDSEQPGTGGVARSMYNTFRDILVKNGYLVGLYASESWYNSYLKGAETDSLWIAKYGPNNGAQNTKPSMKCNLWQYSSRGSVQGISGFVDVNVVLNDPFKGSSSGDTKKKYPKKETDAVYRLFNKKTSEHFFTPSVKERNAYIDDGWKYEGVGWTTAKKNGNKVTRLSGPSEHMYTMDEKEIKTLTKSGWRKEGTVAYSDSKRRTPIYRLRSKDGKKHFFTASKKEKDTLVKNDGWKYEGVGFYGV